MIQIRQLSWIKQSDYYKLREFYTMDIDEFVRTILEKKAKKEKVNKYYDVLCQKIRDEYQNIKAELQVESAPKQEEVVVDPVQIELNKIPIKEIAKYIEGGDLEFRTYENRLIKMKISNLGDLWRINFQPRRRETKAETVVKKWKAWLKEDENCKIVIKDYAEYQGRLNEFETMRYLPENFDRSIGLCANIRKAFEQFAEILREREDDQIYKDYKTLKYDSAPNETFPLELVADCMRQSYIDGKSNAEIARKINLVRTRIQNTISKTQTAILNGDKICKNLQLNEHLVLWINEVKGKYDFRPKNELLEAVGTFDKDIFELLGYDFVTIKSTEFCIPANFKGIYKKVGKNVVDTFKECLLPVGKEEIIENIENKLTSVNGYDPRFIENLLDCEELVDVNDNDEVSLRDEFLTAEQKIAGILSKENNLTNDEVKNKYRSIYGKGFSGNITKVREKLGQRVDSPQRFIKEYAHENIVFKYSDIISALKEKGYDTSKPRTIRAYITNVCSVDTRDKEHFCCKGYEDDYSSVTWRNQARTGITNWVLNQMRDCLNAKDRVTIGELIDHVECQAKGTDYERTIRERTKCVISFYSGEEQPFIKDGDELCKNEEIFDNTDFNSLGLRGNMYPFFLQIRSLLANEIKKTNDGRMLFTDAEKLVNATLDEPQHRNTIRRAIENTYLPPINIKLQNIDDRVYLVLTNDVDDIQPVYTIKESAQDDDNIDTQEIEVVTEDTRPNITYRLRFGWDELSTGLTSELTYYRRWMVQENLNYEEAISKFITVLKESGNSNLNDKLPQSLYEFLFAKNDSSDRDTYLTRLALCYEPLLAEIEYRNEGASTRCDGLGERVLGFPALAWVLRQRFKDTRDFDRVFYDLYYKRNRIAHGEPIDLTVWQTFSRIVEFTALYVYTVAKFCKN